MLCHRGFSAWIVSKECTVPEYLVAVDEPTHRVSCWIPATVGESFSVFWQDHNGGVDTSSFITLDGVTVPGRFLFGDGMASRSGVRVSKTTERPFVFAQIIEEGPSTTSSSVNKEIGMITLKIKRVKRVTIRPANPIQELPSITALGKRKAGDVRVEFGLNEQPLEEQAVTTWGTVPYDDAPAGQSSSYVSFMFRYRTREFLEAQGIITESVRKPLPTTGYRQPQPTDGQQRGSLDDPPPAKHTAEFTPEPESEPLTSASKKPRLGSSSSRPTQSGLNNLNLRSRPTELRRTASSNISSSPSVAAHNPYGIFYYRRTMSSPTYPLGPVGQQSADQSGDGEESSPNTTEESGHS